MSGHCRVEACRRNAGLGRDGAADRRPIDDVHRVEYEIRCVVRAMPVLRPRFITKRADRLAPGVGFRQQEDPTGVQDHRVELVR
jgi:hypothetical protein